MINEREGRRHNMVFYASVHDKQTSTNCKFKL